MNKSEAIQALESVEESIEFILHELEEAAGLSQREWGIRLGLLIAYGLIIQEIQHQWDMEEMPNNVPKLQPSPMWRCPCGFEGTYHQYLGHRRWANKHPECREGKGKRIYNPVEDILSGREQIH